MDNRCMIVLAGSGRCNSLSVMDPQGGQPPRHRQWKSMFFFLSVALFTLHAALIWPKSFITLEDCKMVICYF